MLSLFLPFKFQTTGKVFGLFDFFVFSFSGMVILGAGMYAIKEGCVILRLIAKYLLQMMFMDSFFKVVLFVVVMKAGLALNASGTLILALHNLALCVTACRIPKKESIYGPIGRFVSGYTVRHLGSTGNPRSFKPLGAIRAAV